MIFTIYIKREKDAAVIPHIYVDRAIFLLFYDDQDTASEQWEIQMNTYQIIFTHGIYQRLYMGK